MAVFNKFQTFVGDLGIGKVHDLNVDTLEIYLSNAAPSVSADSVTADLAEIATGNGYTGPQDTQNTASEAGGTLTVVGTDVVITASGGTIGPFRYVVLRNGTPGAGPLIGWWDRGSSVTLQDGDSFTTDFGASLFEIA